MATYDAWPALPFDAWQPTCTTLHLYTQIPGKIRLKLAPREPQWLSVPYYVTSRGMTTSPMPYEERTFEIAYASTHFFRFAADQRDGLVDCVL